MTELTEEARRPQVVCEWADSDVAIVRLLGEHDLASAPAVTQAMQTLARCGESVVVDLSETLFIDSTIIHRLIEADANLASRGQGFALQIGTEPVVAKVVELCGVLKRLGNAPTREETVEIARRSAVSRASALHSVSSTDGFSSGGAGSDRHCGGSREISSSRVRQPGEQSFGAGNDSRVKKPTVIVSDTTPECILRSVREEAAEAGWSKAEIQLLEERATNGDYVNLLETLEEHFHLQVARPRAATS